MSTISNTPMTVAPPVPTATVPATTSLNAEDLQALLQIIDLASQRGAFKAPELSQIGQIFDRVAKFLESIAQSQAAANPTPTTPVTPSVPTVTPIQMDLPPVVTPQAGRTTV